MITLNVDSKNKMDYELQYKLTVNIVRKNIHMSLLGVTFQAPPTPQKKPHTKNDLSKKNQQKLLYNRIFFPFYYNYSVPF